MDPLYKNVNINSQSTKEIFAFERRKHQRFNVELPLNYSRMEESQIHGGIIANISEGGLLAFIHQKLEIGILLKLEIIYIRNLELETIKAISKIVWSDLSSMDHSGEARYGMQFTSMDEKDFNRLKGLLKEVAA